MRATAGAGLLVAALLCASLGGSPAAADFPDPSSPGPVLHEPISPDPREDIALHVALAGELPAAIETRSGFVSAPDPLRPPTPGEAAYGAEGAEKQTYRADRDTRRPSVGAYDDPFTPSTAPFKRMQAFDAVEADGRLRVADERLVVISQNGSAGPQDDIFYANLVVSLVPGRSVRVPSVGAGAHVLRASLSDGGQEMPFRLTRDGAENWLLDVPVARSAFKGRLVMEVGAPRAAFGGPFADVPWERLPQVPALPPGVERDAAKVQAVIGVSRELRPREALARLVAYFRSFEDSDRPPQARGSVYLDLALSKKGVCRHRAFAFVVTALSLGIPARFVMNDVHAWVEVSDGIAWRRIDLGGAGRMASGDRSEEEAPAYRAPPDAFPWPKVGDRAEDMVEDARSGGSAPAMRPDAATSADLGPDKGPDAEHDGAKAVTLTEVDASPHRGQALHLSGEVRADGHPCLHAAVDVWLRSAKATTVVRVGTLATGADGKFAGSLVVPQSVPLGPYDVLVKTPNGEGCAGP